MTYTYPVLPVFTAATCSYWAPLPHEQRAPGQPYWPACNMCKQVMEQPIRRSSDVLPPWQVKLGPGIRVALLPYCRACLTEADELFAEFCRTPPNQRKGS